MKKETDRNPRSNEPRKSAPRPISKKPEQPNLFGEADQLYNTIQEEISIVVAMIETTQEAISKKEDLLADLKERKQKLDKAAATAVKVRDKELKEKKKK